ncbi:MAG: alpha/beta hydrolase [Acidobacteriota bacterium]|nr:alpha/beta hydrolase [Acidobacteriota bacterium]
MRRLEPIAVVLFLLVSWQAGADHAAQAQLEAGSGAVVRVYRTVGPEAGRRTLKAYVFAPAGRKDRGAPPAAAVLLFHGGGWSAGGADWTFPAAEHFAALGMVAISVEYRLSEGEVTPIEALSDVCAAFRWAREEASTLGLDPRRVAGYGVSAGGHLVASTVTVGCPPGGAQSARSVPDALLLLSPAVDVAGDGWFGKLLHGRAAAAAYSPVEHVRKGVPPAFVVQGAADTLTPPAGARRFCAALQSAGAVCQLELFAGLGHLLTRDLADQESHYDPDPAARAEAAARQDLFLRKLGYVREPGR